MTWTLISKPLSELKPYDKNPRLLTKKGMQDLKQSIGKFGLAEPIVANTDGTIIGGHARFMVLQDQGVTECDVYIPERLLAEEEYRELNIRLNKNIAGDWDFEKLANEWELPDLLVWGFEEKDLKFDLPTTEDEPPEVDEVNPPVAQPGDIYQLGKHRLMCGDSTKQEDVEKLMDGQKADMVFTDPPYGVDYEGKTKEALKIQNDKTTNVWRDTLPVVVDSVKQGASFYVCCPAGNNFIDFLTPFSEHCYQSATIIWAKNSLVLGHGDYHYQHEPILYGWRKGAAHQFHGDRTQTTLWQIDRPAASRQHPTMKPIALVAKALTNSSKGDDIVLDPFGGSGTTLIACEQTNRICYMMELDPRYIDVIIKRYEQFTGSKAVKL